jgi:hypothetical protein
MVVEVGLERRGLPEDAVPKEAAWAWPALGGAHGRSWGPADAEQGPLRG